MYIQVRFAGKFVMPILKDLESLELNSIDKMPKLKRVE